MHTCSYYCDRPECIERQRDELRARFEALDTPPPSVPVGWKLVPVEPTEAMQDAHRMYGDTSDWWNATLAAAPTRQPATITVRDAVHGTIEVTKVFPGDVIAAPYDTPPPSALAMVIEAITEVRDFARSTLPGSGVTSRLNAILAKHKVPGCEDCAHNGRYLCDEHGQQQPTADAQAQGGGEVVAWEARDPDDGTRWVTRNPRERDGWRGLGRTIRPLVYGDTAPPSAPVGVEGLVAGCRVLLEQYEASGDFTMGGKLTNRPFMMIRDSLNELFGDSEQLPPCRCSDGPYHYPNCPHRDPEWVDPFAALGASMSGRALAQQPAAVDIEELRRALCVIGVVGTIDGYDVIRRESVLDIIDRRRSALAAQPGGPDNG